MPIIVSAESNGDCQNRNGYYSLILQNVDEHKYIFRDIKFVGREDLQFDEPAPRIMHARA